MSSGVSSKRLPALRPLSAVRPGWSSFAAIFSIVGKTIINHPFGNGLYNLFMVIWGYLGDSLLLFYHVLPTLHTLIETIRNFKDDCMHLQTTLILLHSWSVRNSGVIVFSAEAPSVFSQVYQKFGLKPLTVPILSILCV